MIKLLLICLFIPLVFYVAISMVIIVSPLIIGGLIYITYQAHRREIV